MATTAQRWLVTGGSGMLATDVAEAARAAGHAVTAPGREDLDVTDPVAVVRAVQQADVVVNCAAYTDVDGAEDDAPAAFELNATAAGIVAAAAERAGATMVHISTDYVFSGTTTEPYAANAPLSPRGVYAQSKAEGEVLVREMNAQAMIVRAAWLYGSAGQCFPRTIARAGRERGALRVVNDQRGQPTWTVDVARIVHDLVAAEAPGGVYHATSSGDCTWYDFARAVIKADGSRAKVDPCGTDEFPRPAPRPAYSVLSHDSLTAAGVRPIGPWRERWAQAAPTVLADPR